MRYRLLIQGRYADCSEASPRRTGEMPRLWPGGRQRGALRRQWRPDSELLDLRELTRGKTVLTRLSTQVRTKIRMLLTRHGYECPHRDLLGDKARGWFDDIELEGYAGEMLNTLRALLQVIQQSVDEFETKREQMAAGHPMAQRLRAIPGVGPFLSLALAVEIGDVDLFPSPSHLRGYSGLTPAVYQSGDKDARGPLTKRGNRWLRHAAVLAGQQVAQMRQPDPKLKRTFLAVAFRHGRNPGKVAAARQLLDLIYHLLRKKEDYRNPTLVSPVA